MAPLILSNTAERGFAQVAERLAPQAGAPYGTLVESRTIPTPVMIEKRDNSPNATNVPVVNFPSTSVKALAGIIVFLGIVVIIVAGWKLRAWMRRRKAAKNPTIQSDCESPLPEKIMSEKRSSLYRGTIIALPSADIRPLTKARLLPPTPPVYNAEVSWIPQVRTVNGDPFASPYDVAAKALRTASATNSGEKMANPIQPPKPTARRESRLSKISTMVRPSKSRPASLNTIAQNGAASTLSERPPTPKMTRKKTARPLPPLKPKLPGASSIPPVPAINVLESSPNTDSLRSSVAKEASEEADEQPIVSPRRVDSFYGADRGRVSIFTRQSTASRHSRNLSVPVVPSVPSGLRASSTSTSGTYTALNVPKRLPRLVTVIHIYTASMEDELPIKIGEVLRLNKEFQDGWCAVQRVGKVDAEEGVVPQFCLQDRPDFIPTSKSASSMRTSRSNISSLTSFRLGTPPR